MNRLSRDQVLPLIRKSSCVRSSHNECGLISVHRILFIFIETLHGTEVINFHKKFELYSLNYLDLGIRIQREFPRKFIEFLFDVSF